MQCNGTDRIEVERSYEGPKAVPRQSPSIRHTKKLILIIPEYIHITVVNENGVLHTIKIDKERSLKALMEEVPSCSFPQENQEVILFFEGRQMCPTKDEGTLTSLGLVSGSKLELKVKMIFTTVQVCFPNRSPTVSVRCSPNETFKIW